MAALLAASLHGDAVRGQSHEPWHLGTLAPWNLRQPPWNLGTQEPWNPPNSAPVWRSARPGYPFAFPRDHAAHPAFRIEWWYYTGNLEAADGRRFGYQVTFFRVGVDPAPANPSRWAVRDVYMTHVAVSDPGGRRYRFAERLNRAGPGIAGADTDRYRVWNDDWSASLDANGRHVIRILEGGLGVDLVLSEGRPPTINGRDGYSRKGPSEGNASHYYSLTRMPTRGALTIDGERVEVTGASWMDREFGTNFLEQNQQGWDWLALQLSDGSDLMIYQLRRRDGSRDPYSSGTLTRADGRVVPLDARDFTLVPAGPSHRSKTTGAVYPLGWRIEIPAEAIALTVSTPLADQELDATTSTGVAYWEGLVDVAGTLRGRPVTGRGYLEMTGYAGNIGRFLAETSNPPSRSAGRRGRPSYLRTLEPRNLGTLLRAPRFGGQALEPWNPGTLEPWNPGTVVPSYL